MKKIDLFILGILHKFSNWTFKAFGLNNYAIATILLTFAVIASTYICFNAIELSLLDNDPQIAGARKGSAVMAGIFFSGIALALLRFQKNVAEFLSRKYDLDKTEPLLSGAAVFFRWFFVIMYPVSILIGNKWWGMFDTFLLGISIMFLSCEPPKMEVRMSKIFKE